MATPEEQKFQAYNEALYHASTCRLPECTAFQGRCQKVRSSINHFLNCYSQRRRTSRIDEIEECKHCAKIFGLLCYHAKNCTTAENCVVHMCDYLRRKIGNAQQNSQSRMSFPQETQWPVERRMAEAEANRAMAIEMIRHIVRVKHANGEEIQGLYTKYLY
ncbi:unnamed protein product [Aphanomyces euteiches]|uniref:histone acetyltransferase n=1 Tax=Aphanomyces euteiches TaxID=100861 RepID=A0A6G0W746_9STRA|nr:hypothetical protein Ae201684_018289 [Aphanomyces euteiches]KAG9407189.1 hypothetical protein AC1031_001887 [Aphanomyces cochlioides]KAH9082866.1 hypothetical protein Ae201684P_013771 [Aphanomyces euteiches]